MFPSVNFLIIFSFLYINISCAQNLRKSSDELKIGAEQINTYLPLLKNKRVALVINHTSLINKTNLADTLQKLGVNIKFIYAPEHGFRGTASDGEHLDNSVDTKTGIPLLSLYGKKVRPSKEQLADIDIVIYDIQDVGVRFYTYPTTMHYVMEACAENKKQLIVLDRPNPNGHIIDGPVLNLKYRSMVGYNPVPVLHGLTTGELAKMINGEKWLENGMKCDLQVIENKGYTHKTPYTLPVKPSPNLPNQQAIMLYASLCMFEGTEISVGRGTDTQFQVIGGPNKVYGNYSFTPEPKPGSINPPQKGVKCYGENLTKVEARNMGFSLKYLINLYKKSPDKTKFINNISHFDRLAGSDILRKQIVAGLSEKEIRKSWQKDLDKYKKIREKYRIYE